MKIRYSYPAAKRALDLAVAIPAAIATLPVTAAAAAAIGITSGLPILFRQQRPGLHGKPFELLKFRTMTSPEAAGTTDDGARLTKLGAFLRSTSIDELPSLLNIIRGDLSLVGPRPLLMEYLERYTPAQMRRHDVKPGLTGLAQVRGRNATTWEDRFTHDLYYVDHASLRLDLRILAETILAVLKRRGISADGHATMPTFEGAS